MHRPPSALRPCAALCACALLAACDDFTPAPVEFSQDDVVAVGEVRTLEIRGRVLASLPEAPPATDPAKAELGRRLFWDPILSGDRDVACATCHLPELGYTDGLAQSIGVGGAGRGAGRAVGHVGLARRNAPTVLNTAWNGIGELGAHDPATAPMFWDGRASGLAAQALVPLASREEMRGDALAEADVGAELEARLNAIDAYRTGFAEAFGDASGPSSAPAGAPVTLKRVGEALASFQTTLVANDSPFDRWMRGEPDAMSAAEVSGMQEFVIAGCADCYSGPLFPDFEPHVLGAREGETGEVPDDGAGDFAFRTPTLRQLEFTAPYFHAGQRATLGSAIDFYDEPRASRNPHVPGSALDPELLEVPEMDDGRGDAIARFLHALNDPDFDRTEPAEVPSGLPVGGRLDR